MRTPNPPSANLRRRAARPANRTIDVTPDREIERPTPRTNERPAPGTNERSAPRTNERSDPRTNERSDPRTNERPDPRTNERPVPRATERPAPRALPRAAENAVAQNEGSFVCRAVELEFENLAGTDMFNALNSVRASSAPKIPRARTLAEARGYTDDDLFGLAEIGHAYFKSGGLRLAQVIFEGLAAAQPSEAYFHLSLGLVRDYLGDKAGAKSSYERASQLAPRDPHADLNLAELCLETSDLRGAQALLVRAAHKAAASGQEAVEKKARALHAIASRRLARRRS